MWMLNSYLCGHQYVICWIETWKYIRSDIIPCQYSVMEALVARWDILNLCRYQLQMILPPSHPYVVPKLILVWAPVCYLSYQNQEIYQIRHHSMPIPGDGSSYREVRYTQTLHIPTTNDSTTKPTLCGT